MATSQQRRAAERRRLQRQAVRRQQQLARRRRLNIVVSVVGVLVVVAVVITLLTITNGSDSSPTTSPDTTSSAAKTSTAKTSTARTSAVPSTTTTTAASTTAAAAGAVTTCRYPTAGTASRRVAKPPVSAPTTGTAAVRLATSQGAVTITLNRAGAPCAVNSIVSLVRQRFYNGVACHRLVTRSIFVLQCGDPTGTGRGGPGYSFTDELGTSTLFRRGSVVMANGGPNTNGSQFFIVDRDTNLGRYTPLGSVSAGLAVIDKVYRAGTADGSTDGPPRLPFVFRTATVG